MSHDSRCFPAMRVLAAVAWLSFSACLSVAVAGEKTANDLIAADELTPEVIAGIINGSKADIKVSIDDEGDVVIDAGMNIYVRRVVDKEQGGVFLRIFFMAHFIDGATDAAKKDMVNRFNYEAIIARMCLLKDEDFYDAYFDYNFPLEGGITPTQLLISVGRFMMDAGETVSKADTDKIVKEP